MRISESRFKLPFLWPAKEFSDSFFPVLAKAPQFSLDPRIVTNSYPLGSFAKQYHREVDCRANRVSILAIALGGNEAASIEQRKPSVAASRREPKSRLS